MHTNLLLAWRLIMPLILLGLGANGSPESDSTLPPPPTDKPGPAPLPPQTEQSFRLELVAEGFDAPILLVTPPDGTHRRMIVDQLGVVRVVLPDGTMQSEPFLDIRQRVVPLYQDRDDERGLLGLAFHPRFAANGRLFIFYTTPMREDGPAGWDHTNILAEMRVSPEHPERVDPNTERILLQFDQRRDSHAAGQLAFGPQDGYLYVALGDGLEEHLHPQDREALLGSILRIDVDGAVPYAIPPQNPFVGTHGRDEIYAYGLRHPWRISFDQQDGRLYIAEPAWAFHWQEINVGAPGANYGWPIHTTLNCYVDGTPVADCVQSVDGQPLTPPALEYGPEIGRIVSGVYRYRGNDLPMLSGRLIITDWGFGTPDNKPVLLAAQPDGAPPWAFERLTLEALPDGAAYFWGMGQDSAGELYILTMAQIAPTPGMGKVFKLTAASNDSFTNNA